MFLHGFFTYRKKITKIETTKRLAKTMVRLIKKSYSLILKTCNTVKWGFFLIAKKKSIEDGKIIISEAYVNNKGYDIIPRNWGDDLNKFFIEFITQKKIYFIPYSSSFLKPRKHYILIGSILTFYNLDKSIVYGTGILDPEDDICGIPEKIISVRGPKTRNVLLKRGIECPEAYGDPALLLPLFYDPEPGSSRNRIVVIPNMGTPVEGVTEYCNEILGDYYLLQLTKYTRWNDIIDIICSAKYVVSESLHGLIVAEAYGIPNVWVEFKDHPGYWDFKYYDFFDSININKNKIKMQEKPDYEELRSNITEWEKSDIPYEEFLSYFPFDTNKKNSLKIKDKNGF